MGDVIGGVTDVVMGRRLWEEWSEFWPSADDPFAQFINPVRKHVVTSTLSGDLPWNSVAVPGDARAYVETLRTLEGGDISVAGGIETVRSLFLAGVVDELILTMHPVVTGQGRRLFDERVPTTRLALASARPTNANNAILTYHLRPTG